MKILRCQSKAINPLSQKRERNKDKLSPICVQYKVNSVRKGMPGSKLGWFDSKPLVLAITFLLSLLLTVYFYYI